MSDANRVAVIGTGNVGAPLARRLRAAGYTVVVGARDAAAAADKFAGLGIPVASPADAVVDADIVLLTTPANAAVATARALKMRNGAVLVDCTNPVRWDNGPVWDPPAEGSMVGALAAALPGIDVVKGFSHFGAEVHENPIVSGMPADMFVAGDSVAAKAKVLELATALGYRGLDAGPARHAALLENLAVLWIQLAVTGKGRQFAFKAIER